MSRSVASARARVQPSSRERDAPARARPTRQGAVVEAALARAGGFRSAQDLHAELRADGVSVGLSTVYRHLTGLAESGVVDAVRGIDGEVVYRLCASEVHHHHVVCRACGASVEVQGPEVEAWAVQVAERAGFIDVSHTVEVFGTCSGCASPGPQRGG
jgi:Fur family ferric uptake transcriptional regulator